MNTKQKHFLKFLGILATYAVSLMFVVPWLVSQKGDVPVIAGFGLLAALVIAPVYRYLSK